MRALRLTLCHVALALALIVALRCIAGRSFQTWPEMAWAGGAGLLLAGVTGGVPLLVALLWRRRAVTTGCFVTAEVSLLALTSFMALSL